MNSELLHQLAAREIPDTYDDWPAIRGRWMRLRSERRRRRALGWGLSAVSVVAAIFVAVTLLAVTPLGTGAPATVSAEVLLDRAGAVSDGLSAGTVRTYHVKATNTLRQADGVAVVQQEETWFGGNGQMRQETHAQDWSTLTVNNGSHAWWSVTRAGQTYAAPADGVRFSDTAYLNPLAPEGSNIASVLQFVSGHGCGTFRLEPDQTVAGRAAYVVSVTHVLAQNCANPVQLLAEPSRSPAPNATDQARMEQKRAMAASQPGPAKSSRQVVPGPSPTSVGAMPAKPPESGEPSEIQRILNSSVVDTFWIDKQTFVPLKAEQSLGPKGVSTYEVSSIEYDVSLPPATFDFNPPPGAQMLSDPAAIKQKLAQR